MIHSVKDLVDKKMNKMIIYFFMIKQKKMITKIYSVIILLFI